MAQWGNTRYHFPTPQSSYPPSTSRGRRRFQGGRRQGARFQPRNPQSFSVARTRLTITPAMEQEILDMNIEYLKTQDSEFKCIVAKSCQAAVFFYYGGKYVMQAHPILGSYEMNISIAILIGFQIGTGPQATGCLFLYARWVSWLNDFIISSHLLPSLLLPSLHNSWVSSQSLFLNSVGRVSSLASYLNEAPFFRQSCQWEMNSFSMTRTALFPRLSETPQDEEVDSISVPHLIPRRE